MGFIGDRDLSTKRVVNFHDLTIQKARRKAREAMQAAFDLPEVADPSVIQRAVATLLIALDGEEEFAEWPAAAIAIGLIGSALDQAVKAGVPLDKLLAEVRPVIGA